LLQAASAVFPHGPGTVQETVDACGRGPLGCEPSADGFTMRSALVIDGKSVSIHYMRNPSCPGSLKDRDKGE
jgi:hypothetical protein